MLNVELTQNWVIRSWESWDFWGRMGESHSKTNHDMIF